MGGSIAFFKSGLQLLSQYKRWKCGRVEAKYFKVEHVQPLHATSGTNVLRMVVRNMSPKIVLVHHGDQIVLYA